MRLLPSILFLSTLSVVGEDAAAQSEVAVAGTGPSEERAAVAATLRVYLRVTDNRDKSAIAKSFHPAAVLNSVSKAGTLRSMTQDEWWTRVSRIPADTPPRKSRIVLVDVAGVAAVARIDITDSKGAASTDLFTLQKTSDGWRIVNKVLSTSL